MKYDLGKVVIVQARAPHALVVPVKAQWTNQVQGGAGIGANADDVASIRRNFWLVEHDVHDARCKR